VWKKQGSWNFFHAKLIPNSSNICIIKYFLNIISPNNDLFQKIKTLFANYPEIDLNALGFPQEWENEPLWRQP